MRPSRCPRRLRHDIIQMIPHEGARSPEEVLQGHPVRGTGGLLRHPRALGHARLRLPGHYGAGAFIQGASIELSADAPIREPYTVYLQGGLTFESGKLGVLLAVEELLNY